MAIRMGEREMRNKNRKGRVNDRRNGMESNTRLDATLIVMPARGGRYSLVTHRADGSINTTQFPYRELESHLEKALRRLPLGSMIGLAYNAADLDGRQSRGILENILERYGFMRDGVYRGNGYEAPRFITGVRIVNQK